MVVGQRTGGAQALVRRRARSEKFDWFIRFCSHGASSVWTLEKSFQNLPMRFTHKSFVALGVAFLSPLFLLGCKSTDFAESPPASSYPPPLIPASEPVVQEARPTPSRPAVGGSVKTGDTLELFVEEDDAFNGTYPVREQGDIIIPSVGRIQVAGLSMGSAGERIKTELEVRHLKKATVLLDRVGRAAVAPESAAPRVHQYAADRPPAADRAGPLWLPGRQ